MMPITASAISASYEKWNPLPIQRGWDGACVRQSAEQHAARIQALDSDVEQPSFQNVRPLKEDPKIVVTYPLEKIGLPIPFLENYRW